MPVYLLKISYDGRGYAGLVPQKNQITVLGTIIDVLELKVKRFSVASRTDKGVSALENYVVLETDNNIDKNKIKNLEKYRIKILEIKELPEFIRINRFVEYKIYEYSFLKEFLDKIPIFKPKYLIKNNEKIIVEGRMEDFNPERIRRNLKYFIGLKNFQNFCKGRPQNPYCEILDIKFEINDYIKFEFKGRRFLYEMIRKLVSFFLSLGYGMFKEEYVPYVFDYILDPKPPSANPEFLILKRVKLIWE